MEFGECLKNHPSWSAVRNPQFISHGKAIWKGSHNLILRRGLNLQSPWLLSTYSFSHNHGSGKSPKMKGNSYWRDPIWVPWLWEEVYPSLGMILQVGRLAAWIPTFFSKVPHRPYTWYPAVARHDVGCHEWSADVGHPNRRRGCPGGVWSKNWRSPVKPLIRLLQNICPLIFGHFVGWFCYKEGSCSKVWKFLYMTQSSKPYTETQLNRV